MDLTFHCPNCKQELAVDASAAGQTIQCPTCHSEISVPIPDVTNIHPLNPIASSASARVEHHFSVPVRDVPAEVLIQKPTQAQEELEADRGKLKMRIFRHSDCIEVGHDRYEEFVSQFLNRVGEPNIVSITPLSYTHLDIATQKLMTDYALQIIYRG